MAATRLQLVVLGLKSKKLQLKCAKMHFSTETVAEHSISKNKAAEAITLPTISGPDLARLNKPRNAQESRLIRSAIPTVKGYSSRLTRTTSKTSALKDSFNSSDLRQPNILLIWTSNEVKPTYPHTLPHPLIFILISHKALSNLPLSQATLRDSSIIQPSKSSQPISWSNHQVRSADRWWVSIQTLTTTKAYKAE